MKVEAPNFPVIAGTVSIHSATGRATVWPCSMSSLHPNPFPVILTANSLAYAEMRFILARFVWNFDLSLDERSRNWMDHQQAYLIWEKPPLYMNLKPRAHKTT